MAAPERRPRRIRVTIWVVGVAVSLGLAIVPPLAGSSLDIQLGIVLGLTGVVIGLMIDQSTRVEAVLADVGRRLSAQGAQVSGAIREITPVMAASEECRAAVLDYVDSFGRIDRHADVQVFADIRQTRTEELLETLRDLANGSVTVSIDGPYSVRARTFDDVASYHATSMGPFEFWKSAFGRRYLETQRTAIVEHGLSVERIFVFDDAQDPSVEAIIRMHVAIGVRTLIVYRGWIPQHQQEYVIDEGILTFRNGARLLMQPRAAQGRKSADSERLSVIGGELRAAEFRLGVARSCAVPFEADSVWPVGPGRESPPSHKGH